MNKQAGCSSIKELVNRQPLPLLQSLPTRVKDATEQCRVNVEETTAYQNAWRQHNSVRALTRTRPNSGDYRELRIHIHMPLRIEWSKDLVLLHNLRFSIYNLSVYYSTLSNVQRSTAGRASPCKEGKREWTAIAEVVAPQSSFLYCPARVATP